ncbi:hypothetical protein ACFE04_013789 [Oxalis oulophora]
MLEALQAPALKILASPESEDPLIQRKFFAAKCSDEGIEEEAEEAYALIAVEKEIVESSSPDEVMANLLDISAEKLSTTVDTQVEIKPNTGKCQFCLPSRLGSSYKKENLLCRRLLVLQELVFVHLLGKRGENNFRVRLEVDSENDMDAEDEDLSK